MGTGIVWQAAGFLLNAVGAHALPPESYGSYATGAAMLALFSPLLLSVQTVTSRGTTMLIAARQESRVLGWVARSGTVMVVGTVLLTAATILARRWISSQLHIDSSWIVVLVAASFPIYVAGHVLAGVFQGAEEFNRFALETVVEGLAKLVFGVVAMLWVWHTSTSGIGAIAGSAAVGLITYVLLLRPLLKRWQVRSPSATVRPEDRYAATPRLPLRVQTTSLRYSITTFLAYGLLAVMFSADTLVAKHYFTKTTAGLYAGVSLAGKVVYYATSSLGVFIFPLFSRHHDEGSANQGRLLLVSYMAVAAIAGTVVIFYRFDPGLVVTLLLGPRYRRVERYLTHLGLVFALYSVTSITATWLLAKRRGAVVVLLLLAATCLEMIGFYYWHQSIHRLLDVLTLCFGASALGGVMVTALSGGSSRGSAGKGY